MPLVFEALPASSCIHQTDMGVIALEGPDSAKLLQGQTTVDMKLVTPEQACYGAVCTPKGRILANFYVLQYSDNHYLLMLKKDLVEALLMHLKKYAVFFKTQLSDQSENFHVVSTLNLKNDVQIQTQYDLAIPVTDVGAGKRLTMNHTYLQSELLIQPVAELLPEPQHGNAHALLTLLSAQPLLNASHKEEILPQWINMQRNGGISFTKGCYTGQEIVARMKYRGKSKKHLALFSLSQTAPIGEPVIGENGNAIGEVFDCASFNDCHIAQVLLNVDQSEAAHATIQGKDIELIALPYELGN